MKRLDDDERLDRLGRALIDALAMSDAEVEAAASSFVCSRVWARIAAERERRAASATWLDMLIIGRQTVPAMLTTAFVLAVWFWIGSARSIGPSADALDSRTERVVLTGVTMLSDDDMLAYLINWPVGGAASQEERR
jgi:hypothetical protein